MSKDLEFSKRSKPEQETILSIASSLISLLTALAEAQDEILEAISRNATIIRLLFLLTSDELASNPEIVSLRSDALACLMILCEDNEQLSDLVVNTKQHRTYGTLLSLRKTANGDGVLACGVLHNLFSSLEDQDIALGADNSLLIPTLSQALKAYEPGQMYDGVGWANPFEYQQLALEILASIGTTLNTAEAKPQTEEKSEAKDDEDMADADADEDVSDGEEEGGEEEEEMDDDELEADMELVTGADRNEEDSNIDDLPILKTLIDNALPELIRIASLSPTDDTSLRMQGHALAALNNIAWSVSLIDFTTPLSRTPGIPLVALSGLRSSPLFWRLTLLILSLQLTSPALPGVLPALFEVDLTHPLRLSTVASSLCTKPQRALPLFRIWRTPSSPLASSASVSSDNSLSNPHPLTETVISVFS